MIHPALYEVEPIGINGKHESNGTVYYFCDNSGLNACRNLYLRNNPQLLRKVIAGTSPDAIQDTVCDFCGAELNH